MIASEPKIGDVLDSRYRITGLLGTGGMGSVYRAEHVTIKRPVAIKVLHPDYADDPDYAKRFEREAFVTGRTDHPNCVTVSDFGPLDSGGFYLVERRKLPPGQLPSPIHWFKWEAGMTFLTGFPLLVLVYYMTGGVYLVDPAVSSITPGWAVVRAQSS